jgi:voltage-gated potassium channel Kch
MLGFLLVGTAMVSLTVIVHFAGLAGLLLLLRNRPRRKKRTALFSQASAILFIVFSLMALHTAQIWLYAALYFWAGALPDFETALYFSTVSFTTVGYGDIVLSPHWRIVGAIESANGLLLFGWSTAFLATTTAQLSTLEANWLQRASEDQIT